MLSDIEKIYGLSLLWKETEYNFANFQGVPDLNWDEAYKVFIDEVVKTNTDVEYYKVLQKFMALLKDGHTKVVLPEKYRKNIFYPKVTLRSLDKKIIVAKVSDEKLIGKLKVGSEILEIDNTPIKDYLENNVVPYISSSTEHYLWTIVPRQLLMSYEEGSVKVKVRTPDGELIQCVIEKYNLGEGGFDEICGEEPESVRFEWIDNNIAYIWVNHFGYQEIYDEFIRYLPQLRVAKGIIIDIRNNMGGNSAIAKKIIKLFTDEVFLESKWKTPKHIASFKAWRKLDDCWYKEEAEEVQPSEDECIKVPMAVLISNFTFSAAEDFLVGLDSINRATYIGQRTGGSTGQPLWMKLPGGAPAGICSKRDSYPDGREFVGYGIEPHINVEQTLEDILGITDNTLDKAIEFIKKKIV